MFMLDNGIAVSYSSMHSSCLFDSSQIAIGSNVNVRRSMRAIPNPVV